MTAKPYPYRSIFYYIGSGFREMGLLIASVPRGIKLSAADFWAGLKGEE